MSHIFISYSRRDLDFAQKIVDALGANHLDTWIDWKSIPKGEDWEQEIYRGIEAAEAFLFLISPDSVHSKMCNKEIVHAVKNGKRILPIFIRETIDDQIPEVIRKHNWIFCRDGQDDFDKAVGEIQTTIHTDYEWLKYHTRLQVKALEWERTKDTSRLLRGKELREAEEQLAKSHIEPQATELQRNYLLASRNNEERQRRQLTIGLGIGLAVVAILSVFAWGQRNVAIASESTAIAESNAKATVLVDEEYARATAQAERDRAEQIAGDLEMTLEELKLNYIASVALNNQETNPELSILLSIEAYKRNTSPLTFGTLLTQAQNNQQLSKILDGQSSLAFSPDGAMLASSGSSKSILLWDVLSGQKIGDFRGNNKFYGEIISFSSNDSRLITVEEKNRVGFWDVASKTKNKEVVIGQESGNIIDIAMSPDHSLFATSTSDSNILLWDLASGEQFGKPLVGGIGWIRNITFSPDNSILAGISGLRKIYFWDVATGQQLGDPIVEVENWINDFSFSPDGSKIVTGGWDQKIRIWDVLTRQQIGESLSGHENEIYIVDFSPDGTKIVSADENRLIYVWDAVTHKQINNPFSGHADIISSLEFSPDSSLVASSSSDGTIRLWDLENRNAFGRSIQLDHHDSATRVLSSDGKTMVSGGWDSLIKFWDVSKGQNIGHTITTDYLDVPSIAISPDGFILASSSYNNLIQLWNIQTGNKDKLLVAGGSENWLNILRFSPHGSLLASGGGDGIIRLWDPYTGEEICNTSTEHTEGISTINFSPDGTIIASGGREGKILLWNASNLTPISSPLVGHSETINDIAFSSDSRILATASNDGSVRLWNVNNGNQIGATMLGHTNIVSSLVFSPDDSILVSGDDIELRLWDVETSQLIGPPLLGPGYGYGTVDLAFWTNNYEIISVGYDEIIIYDIDPNKIINQLCQAVNRELTLEEWKNYFPGEEYRITCPQ